MKVYAQSPSDGFVFINTISDTDCKLLSTLLTGRSLNKHWIPFPVKFVTRGLNGRQLKASDAPGFTPGELALTEAARSVLGPYINECGEILPLKCESADFYLLNITNIIDALDESRSRIERYSSGRIMHISEYIFNRAMLANQFLFRISSFAASPIYFTDTAVEIWMRAGLRGLDFRLLWDDEADNEVG